ncbi:hypothetical protein DN387_14050 [Pseudomonas sp. FBF18]|uniref:RHS domain-containing protein n=1 Tax=Pseudomonas sp. FBF18 TaxID=1451377 RepID=UPI0006D3C556|nr:hypothetical protein [Pseudomonas sp. FBF18]
MSFIIFHPKTSILSTNYSSVKRLRSKFCWVRNAQCDHLGTPMELTDQNGEMAWAGQYKAWGEVYEERSAWARQMQTLKQQCIAAHSKLQKMHTCTFNRV